MPGTLPDVFPQLPGLILNATLWGQPPLSPPFHRWANGGPDTPPVRQELMLEFRPPAILSAAVVHGFGILHGAGGHFRAVSPAPCWGASPQGSFSPLFFSRSASNTPGLLWACARDVRSNVCKMHFTENGFLSALILDNSQRRVETGSAPHLRLFSFPRQF